MNENCHPTLLYSPTHAHLHTVPLVKFSTVTWSIAPGFAKQNTTEKHTPCEHEHSMHVQYMQDQQCTRGLSRNNIVGRESAGKTQKMSSKC